MTRVKGLIQSLRLPCSAQKPSGIVHRPGVHLGVTLRTDQAPILKGLRHIVDVMLHRVSSLSRLFCMMRQPDTPSGTQGPGPGQNRPPLVQVEVGTRAGEGFIGARYDASR